MSSSRPQRPAGMRALCSAVRTEPGPQRGGELVLDVSRRDGIYANSARPTVRERSHQIGDPRLARRIGADAPASLERDHRRGHQDRLAVLHRPCAARATANVDTRFSSTMRRKSERERPRSRGPHGTPGVADAHVYASETLDRTSSRLLGVLRVREVVHCSTIAGRPSARTVSAASPR